MKKLLILLIPLLLFSCNKETKNNLNIALSQNVVSLDISTSSSISGRTIMDGNIYEKLFSIDDDKNIKYIIASSLYLSEDEKRLSFTLRDDKYFSDGKRVEKEDVLSSLNRWLNLYPKALELSNGNYFISNDNEIYIESPSSLLFLFYALSSSPLEAVIMEKDIIEKEYDQIKTHIGTGPYKIENWYEGEKIVLSKNEYYKDSSPFFDTLTYYFVPDYLSRILGLEDARYDVIDNIIHEDMERIEKSGENRVSSGGDSGSIAIVFNNKEGICSNKNIRQGISYLLDNKTLMSSCYGSGGFNTSSSFMEEDQEIWNTGNINPYSEKDITKAKEKLKNYNGEKVRILVPKLSNLDKIALSLSFLLEEGGVKSEIILTDWVGMLSKRKDPSSWDIYISSFTRVSNPTLKSYLSPTFPCWIDFSSSGICLLQKMEKSGDVSLWEKAEGALYEECPVYIPGHYETEYGISNKIKGEIIKEGIYFQDAKFV